MQDNLSTPTLAGTLGREEDKLLACIHCGLCLEACPTYVITGDENDGPRGRLYLMRAVGEGRLPKESQSFEQHIDRCLGCRACEQVCPAGVEYGQLLEAARAELFSSRQQPGFTYKVLRFALKHIWLYPARLRFVFAIARLLRESGFAGVLLNTGLARILSHRFEFALALLQSSRSESGRRFSSEGKQSHEPPRVSRPSNHPAPETKVCATSNAVTTPAMLFTGCVGEGLFSRVNKATARVLKVNGIEPSVPEKQVCCGALHAHAGDLAGARALAQQNIKAFSDIENVPVVTNAGGCGAMLASYGHLLSSDETFAADARKFSERIRDISQQLKLVGSKAGSSVTTEPITYDASCHLLYGQHAGEAPLEMLAAISKLNLARLEGSERCCGGAGIYNLLEPELSREVLAEKLANIQASGAQVLATGNPGCQMQIGAGALLAGMNLRICHPVELLDESYARAGMYGKD
ncbi:MAG TPA: heterodisulfide reductase-related iron-sulfur binding cluster [Pyrinomonadaceae bacterium]|nr:heterodisulfide reductase-related iron-sulfur binding cluster [Pyrinomonadaceae bacterium]